MADHWPKRPLILATQAGLLLLALLLGLLTLWGHITPWQLFAVSLASGLVNAVDLPARLAFIVDMVGPEDLLNAVALNSLVFNIARAVGPPIGAVMLQHLGPGECFLVNAGSYLAVLAALWAMRPTAVVPTPAHRTPSCRRVSPRRRRPGLLLLLGLAGVMALLGWPVLSLLPALADQQLEAGKGEYGLLVSATGVGAVLGAMLVATFGSLGRRQVFLGGGVAVSAAALAGLALARTLTPAMICCMALGAGLILFFATGQAVMQLSAGEHNRGRVMGVWSMVLSGANRSAPCSPGWSPTPGASPACCSFRQPVSPGRPFGSGPRVWSAARKNAKRGEAVKSVNAPAGRRSVGIPRATAPWALSISVQRRAAVASAVWGGALPARAVRISARRVAWCAAASGVRRGDITGLRVRGWSSDISRASLSERVRSASSPKPSQRTPPRRWSLRVAPPPHFGSMTICRLTSGPDRSASRSKAAPGWAELRGTVPSQPSAPR